MAKSRKNNKYRTKKRHDKRRNKRLRIKKTKRFKESKLNNKIVSYQKGGDDIRVEGGVGEILEKFYVYKDKYMRPRSASRRILYIVKKGGDDIPRMYFSNSDQNKGEQLEEVSGSSPPLGINNWAMELDEGEDKKIGNESVHSIIRLYPITGHRPKIGFGKNEYVGQDGGRYNIPLTFGLASDHPKYSSAVKKIPNSYRTESDPDFINTANTLLINMLEKCGVRRQ